MCLITFSWYERRTSAGTPSSIRKNAFTACKKVHLAIYVLPAKSAITELLPEKRKYIHCLQKGAFTACRKKSTFTACKKEAPSMPAKRKHIRGLQKESTFTDCNKKAHSLPAKRKHIHCLEEESAFTVCQKKALSLRTANLICIR